MVKRLTMQFLVALFALTTRKSDYNRQVAGWNNRTTLCWLCDYSRRAGIKILVVLLSLAIQPSYSQSLIQRADSLKKQLLHTYELQSKTDLLYGLASTYDNLKPDSGLYYAEQLMNLAVETGNQRTLAYAYSGKGLNYWAQGRQQQAKEFHDKAVKAALQLQDTMAIVDCYANLALAYEAAAQYDTALALNQTIYKLNRNQGDTLAMADNLANIALLQYRNAAYDQAMSTLLKAIEFYEHQQALQGLGYSFNLMGVIQKANQNPRKALKYYLQSVTAYQQIGEITKLGNVYNNMGIIHKDLEQLDSALFYYEKAADIARSISSKWLLGKTLTNKGNIYGLQQKFNRAAELHSQAVEIYRSSGDRLNLAISYANLGDVLAQGGDYTQGEANLRKSLKIIKTLDNPRIELEIYPLLIGLYEQTHKYARAFRHQKRYKQLSDSIFTKEKMRRIEELQVKYETEKKKRQNQLLRKENELHQLEIASRHRQLVAALGVAGIILLLLGFVVNLYLKKHKAYLKLVEKNSDLVTTADEAREAHKELLELKKIQHRLQSEEATINERLQYLMAKKKVYLQPELTVQKLAEAMKVPRSTLSNFLSKQHKLNFNEYINHYRILEAQRLLADKEYSLYTIKAIGEMCGFNSERTFYHSFKQVTGLTPAFYQKKYSRH